MNFSSWTRRSCLDLIIWRMTAENLCGGRNMLRCAKCVQFQTHLARSHKFNINIFTDASISPKWWLCRISASCFHLFQVFKSSTENERNALFSIPSRDLLASTVYTLKKIKGVRKSWFANSGAVIDRLKRVDLEISEIKRMMMSLGKVSGACCVCWINGMMKTFHFC